MFQNIAKDQEIGQKADAKNSISLKEIIKNTLSKQNLIIYLITFMVSMVSMGNMDLAVCPFGIAIVAAALSYELPIAVIYLVSLIGTAVRFGGSNTLIYIAITLLFFFLVLLIRPNGKEDTNEKKKVGAILIISSIVVQMMYIFVKGFYVYNFLTSIMVSIASYIFYKIFVNALPVIKEYGIKKAFSIEEVMGAGLLIAIAIAALGDFRILSFSLRNILSILMVLIMGWKNGMLVGATSGITIGVVIGIIGDTDPILIGAYAISGLIAGLLNHFGKIGVAVGFLLGNVLVAYAANGGVENIILFQEILIASVGLFAVPKNIKINIEDLYKTPKLLPEGGKRLEESQQILEKLSGIKDAVSEMAQSYKEAAASVVEESKSISKEEEKNKQIFLTELRNNLDGLEENILYDDLYNNEKNVSEDIFLFLIENEIMTENDLVEIFQSHNEYLLNYDEKSAKRQALEEIRQALRAINGAYKVSKVHFIWERKLEQSKKKVSSQLEEVKNAISSINVDNTEKDEYEEKRKELLEEFKQKDIDIKDLTIKKGENGQFVVNLYTNICQNEDGSTCPVKQIKKVLTNSLKEKMVLQKQECGLRLEKNTCMYTYLSEDKYLLQVGMARRKKSGSIVSGDSILQTRLEDGKYLLAISDGMGTGPEARKNSKIVLSMLEKLLGTGFSKDTSVKLINATLNSNNEEDMYATLDAQILDLYSGKTQMLKNGACPTYIKRRKNVSVIEARSLPTGVSENIEVETFETKLEDGDIIVICSDGIIESNSDYTNKELWVKHLLEEIETDDVQRIADILTREAVDNDYGKEKDDMTVICIKVNKRR